MNEDYLWDRSGPPDPETERLEKLFNPLRYADDFRADARPPRRMRAVWWLAAAAALIAAIAVPLLRRGPLTDWRLPDGSRIRAGQTIDAASQTRIEDTDTGTVSIDPGSRLSLLAANAQQHRFDLAHGTIHAYIWAPPGKFVVDTASSKTIDLGCMYSLQVSADGTGLLKVEAGWVAFERNHIESFIPAGAACVTRPKTGPGTPYFADAPRALIDALARFDTAAGRDAVDSAIAAARPRDALSLWHLLLRTNGSDRAHVYDRLAALVSLPPQASRSGVLAGDRTAIDAAWNALNLGDTDWWRMWKRRW